MKIVNSSGKKKTAIARATIRDGEGRIRVNKVPLDIYQPEVARLKIREALIFAEDLTSDVDIDVRVRGGGVIGQADAARTAIARGLVEWSGDTTLRDQYLDYDRTLLVNDVRQKEPKKYGGPGARAKFQKSYR